MSRRIPPPLPQRVPLSQSANDSVVSFICAQATDRPQRERGMMQPGDDHFVERRSLARSATATMAALTGPVVRLGRIEPSTM